MHSGEQRADVAALLVVGGPSQQLLIVLGAGTVEVVLLLIGLAIQLQRSRRGVW